MTQRPTTSDLRPVPAICRFVFVGGKTSFVVTKPLIQATSTLFADTETEDLPNEKPEHFRAYLQWVEGKGIITNQNWERRDGDIWLELGELWFFGQRIGAHQFQDAVILKCMEKRTEQDMHGINAWTVSHFFEPPFEIKSPFHTFLVDTYFMEATDLLDDYDNDLFSMACSARQVYLSEAIAKMMIKKRKREQKRREEKKRRTWKLLPEEEPVEEPITLSVLFDYLVSTPSPNNNNDHRGPSTRRGADSSDEDERGSTRMRGSVKLDLIKRVLKYGTVD